MKAYLFPGQGSQARGMGASLFDEFPELTAQADRVLGYSIKELCLSDPRRELNKTQFTQPALYVVNALSYYKRVQLAGEQPDFVAGHSLGEFNALLAAECFDFETGLKLVKQRGELMSQATEGAMAAILNATRSQVEALLKSNRLNRVDIANYNTPLQIVISGPLDEITACESIFQFDKVMFVPLNTSGAFHSRLMLPAQGEFQRFLAGHRFAEPKIPVIANWTAKPYPGGAAVAEYLSNQICSTVLWSDTIQSLISLEPDIELIEVGHGDVLTKMIPKIKEQLAKVARNAPTPAVASAAQQENPFALAEQKVAAWNQRHPVGTKVRSRVLDYGDLVTRTPAIVLFGHRAAVYMERYNGYFDLDEILAA
ncbi:ACP S-malonyltransferase [Steroidobacter sp. S1-65]|uniref:[acyl-carrier-protein] S-malonyltransferase n=1 Tax=Steroidobacter gossypii TaxID=2805490 RepID=A0ABS1WUD6_9GAMM|nr:ACP S-malonyltransferase [Steroidobacter gossypii]MBM0104586.1 ACP S-malonyltransferase [Steroidobacter gossypii]